MNKIRLMQEASRCLICENAPCSEEDLMAAEKACIHYDRPVRLRDLAHALPNPVCEEGLPAFRHRRDLHMAGCASIHPAGLPDRSDRSVQTGSQT